MSKLRLKEEATTVPTPPSGYVTFYAKTDGKIYFKDDTGTEYAVKPVGGGTGDLLSDGSVPLIADWDVGPHKITAQQLESDVATGTTPLVIASVTLVANLNADLLDGYEAAAFLLLAATSLTGAGFFLDDDTFAADDDTKVASQQSTKAYIAAQIAAAITGLYDDKGNYDANTNTPDLDTSPSGSIQKGDVYTVSVAGDFFTVAVEPGDTVRALQDAPTLESHWAIVQGNLINAIVDADFSAAEGMLRKTGAGTYEAIKNNFSAVDAPDANDDSSAGYSIGSKWHDTVAKLVYTCINASVGAAVWAVGGGGLKPVFIAVGDSPYSANAGEIVFCDTSGGAITVTLPAAPLNTDNIWVVAQADAATYNVTIGRNGKTILGVAADFVIDQAWGDANLAYESASGDWWGNIHGTPSLVESQVNALINAATIGRKTKYFRMDKDMRVGLTQNPSAEVTIGGASGVGQHVARTFDGTAVEYVLFDWMAPKNYDEAWGFAFIPVWSATTTDVGNAVFELRPKAHANNGAIAGGHTANSNYSIDGSLGTADTALYGPESSPMTTGGINKGELVNFRFQRLSIDAADTLDGIDINIIGCILVWHTDAPTED